MRIFAFLVAVSLFSIAGCKQGVGDRCQVDSDCDDGLICILPPDRPTATGGSCQPRGGVDSGVPVDLGGAADLTQVGG